MRLDGTDMAASEPDLRAALELTGALSTGHFQLASGRHSAQYMQCARLLEYPEHAQTAARAMIDQLRAHGIATGDVDTVVAPALGGMIIGYELARQLGARSIFVERDRTGAFVLRRGFSLAHAERVIVVEDVVTTGGSAREAAEVALGHGADVICIAAIVDRSGGGASLPAPLVAPIRLDLAAVSADQCSRCADGEPIDAPGTRMACPSGPRAVPATAMPG